MAELMPIEKINVYRGIAPDKNLDGNLKKSLKVNGQLAPILVDAEHVLIDGLRRLNALKELGATEILVTVSTTYEGSCAALAVAHDPEVRLDSEAPPINSVRLWELYQSLRRQSEDRVNRLRRLTDAERSDKATPSRKLLTKAIGMRSDAEYQNVVTLHNNVDIPGEIGEFSQDLINKMDQGEITIYQAKRAHDMWVADRRKIRDKPRQLQVLTRVAASASGLTGPLKDISFDLDEGFTARELDQLQRVITAARNTLTAVINKIKRARERIPS